MFEARSTTLSHKTHLEALKLEFWYVVPDAIDQYILHIYTYFIDIYVSININIIMIHINFNITYHVQYKILSWNIQ